MEVTEPVRKAAMSWRSNKEAASSLFLQLGAGEPEGSGSGSSSVKREEVIFNARTNWELLRSQSCLGPPTTAPSSGPGARPGTAGGVDQDPFDTADNEDKNQVQQPRPKVYGPQ